MGNFNDESGVSGWFGERFYPHCKLFRYDGTMESMGPDDYRAKRGLLIRDHYGPSEVVKVHYISGNLERFLIHDKIEHKRQNLIRT